MTSLRWLAFAFIFVGCLPSSKSATPWLLRLKNTTCTPGEWTTKSPLPETEVAEPMIMGEDISSDGIRIRSYFHKGQACDWVTTNQGMKSPDGPYWISQVQSDKPGACVESYCVGDLSGIKADTILEVEHKPQILNVVVSKGKIRQLILAVDNPIHP